VEAALALAVAAAAVVLVVVPQAVAVHPGVGSMINAAKVISEADCKRIQERIASLEKVTDAEVVCAVATESGRYDRAESVCGLLVGLLALISSNKLLALGGWDSPDNLALGWQVTTVVVGFVLGSILSSYWHPLRRLFVSQNQMAEEVRRSVHQVFCLKGVGGTRHRGGVLIYLSLFERRLEVLSDQALAEKLSQADLEAIRDAVLEQIRAGQFAGGLLAGLDSAEERLARMLPATEAASESLSNELILFHPRP